MNRKPRAPSSVHAAAAAGYADAAATYRKGRPDYPLQIGKWLREAVGLRPGRTVLDLGAGTGKFLPLLRDTGATVVAVEPVDAMRAELAADYPEVRALSGTAQAIPLADASVDAVVCAQAFHWFASRTALDEITRVLRPGGVLALVWNVRDARVAWVNALSVITDAHEDDAPRYRSGDWARLLPADGFTELPPQTWPNAHVGPAESVVVDRTLSTSFIAALPAATRRTVAAKVRALIAATPELGAAIVSFPYQTVAYGFQKSVASTIAKR